MLNEIFQLLINTTNMKKVVLIAFTKLGQDALSVYAYNVLTLMMSDEQFTSLDVDVAELKKCYDAYVLALNNNVNGGRVATIEKNKCKKVLTVQMSTVALLVNNLAKGDESIIMAAGFDVRKSSESYDSLAAPNVRKLINETTAGLVTVQLSKVAGATNYGIEKRIKPEGEETAWMNGEYSSALKFQLTGLESGKTYQFHFRSIGNKGLVSPWSSILEVLVS